MDYLEEIKKEFPQVKPYSGDLDWDNQAYGYLREKNYERAEILFKKICISEPDHHSGFEGLAYVYYTKGEFEKAEWFMQEALKRAKKFIEQDAIDLNVITKMEACYQSIIGREPLETLFGGFNPREGENLFSTDLYAWLENVYAAPFQRCFQMTMEALEKPPAFELLEEVECRGEMQDQQRFQDFFFNFVQFLRNNKEMEKCRQLLEKCRLHQPALYRKDYCYYDRYLIQQSLFQGEYKKVRDYMNFFIEEPVPGIDELIVVLQLLLFYRLNGLAEELSKKVVAKISKSHDVITGAEEPFEDIIFSSVMEMVFHQLQRGEHPSWQEVDESLKDFEISPDKEIFETIIHQLSPGDDREKIEFLLQNQDDLSRGNVLSFFLWQFNKYMLEEKEVAFSTSSEIYRWLIRGYKIEEELRGGLPADLFLFPRDSLKNHLIELGGFLSNQWPKVGALIWGSYYFYDFLLEYEIISETCYQEALEGINQLKKEFIENYKDQLWHFSFVHQWPRPDSIKESDWEAEKKDFRQSFFERPEVIEEWAIIDQGEEKPETMTMFDYLVDKKQPRGEKDQRKKKTKRKQAKKQKKKQRKGKRK